MYFVKYNNKFLIMVFLDLESDLYNNDLLCASVLTVIYILAQLFTRKLQSVLIFVVILVVLYFFVKNINYTHCVILSIITTTIVTIPLTTSQSQQNVERFEPNSSENDKKDDDDDDDDEDEDDDDDDEDDYNMKPTGNR